MLGDQLTDTAPFRSKACIPDGGDGGVLSPGAGTTSTSLDARDSLPLLS